jgi:hypothetical protein
VKGLCAADAPVVRFGIFWVEFYCARCDREAFQLVEMRGQKKVGGGGRESAETHRHLAKHIRAPRV